MQSQTLILDDVNNCIAPVNLDEGEDHYDGEESDEDVWS